MERDETTTIARTDYCKLPSLNDTCVVVIDPMLATGHSAELALEAVLKQEPDNIVMVSMIASPE
jgi:uracil phosphoribosyltransferase